MVIKKYNKGELSERLAKIDTLIGLYEGQEIKLHIGCGKIYKEGWINIDNNSDYNISKLDLDWDMENTLPFPDNSVSYIYHEHFLEHVSALSAIKIIKNCLRMLKPHGIMRIAVPDLEKIIAVYHDKNWIKNNQAFIKKQKLSFAKTPAALLNVNMRAWGHMWMYDWEELEYKLKEAGAEHICQCQEGQSEHIVFHNIETRGGSIVAEVTKV